jgi:hypothetical protein
MTNKKEYKVIEGRNADDFQTQLNVAAQQGYELVNCFPLGIFIVGVVAISVGG